MLNGVLPSLSYDPDRSQTDHLSPNPSTAEVSDNLISFDQQLPSQSQPPINYAESYTDNMSHADSTLSSNPVLLRDAPSTNHTTPIGTGSPSYTHNGNDALAEGNVDVDGDADGFPPPSFDMSIFRHVTHTDTSLRSEHHWAINLIGSQFAYKQGELEDEIGDRNQNPSNRWLITNIISYDGDRHCIPSSTPSVYRNKDLHFLCYSFDRPFDYDVFPVSRFKLNLRERDRCFKIIFDSNGNPPSLPLHPPPPQQRSQTIDINFMQGVPDTSSIAMLTPHQMGVLLTFQPANSQYIKDPVVLTNVRKAYLHCLQKINGTDKESETAPSIFNLKN